MLEPLHISCYFTWRLKMNFSLLVLFRDSLPTLCGEHSGSVSQLANKRCTLGLGDLQRVATEVR